MAGATSLWIKYSRVNSGIIDVLQNVEIKGVEIKGGLLERGAYYNIAKHKQFTTC